MDMYLFRTWQIYIITYLQNIIGSWLMGKDKGKKYEAQWLKQKAHSELHVTCKIIFIEGAKINY